MVVLAVFMTAGWVSGTARAETPFQSEERTQREEQAPLRSSSLPYMPAHIVYARELVIRNALQAALDRKVEIVVPSTLEKGREDVLIGNPEIAQVSPMHVQLAMDAGYEVLVAGQGELWSEVYVRLRSPVTEVRQLLGRPVGTNARSSLLRQAGEELLSAHGIEISRDVKLVVYPTQSG